MPSKKQRLSSDEQDSEAPSAPPGLLPFVAATILQLVIQLTWACLCVPTYKAGLFMQVLCSKTVITEILTAASLSFCPGLLEIVYASAPPIIEFFMGLPSAEGNNAWGIYVLVLKKTGAVPLI